ncbi:MAG: RNB domain-containing ribonuclease [Elusimicrobia bacterium]|nr:RNB domain-containing ribonuclease [Elusimicrobiota bacterium]
MAARAEGRTVSMAELHYRKAAPAPERPKPIMTEHETPQTSARELVIEVEMSKSPKVQQQLERIVQRMARRLRTGARPKLQAKAGSKGALWTIRIALRADADSRAQASRATKFLTHEASGLRLLSLSQPSEGKTYVAEPAEEAPAQEAPESALTDSPEPAVQAAPAPASDSVGQATLGLLDKFTVSGPRPIERGDAFLYAQGAKAVPAELEDAWKRRSVKRRTKPGDSVVRTLLTRREGRAYVRIPKTGNSGREMMMQERVPDYMAEGIISGALVNVKMNGDRFEYVEPIGAYPMDMMIGRVVSGPNGPALAGIFFEGQKPVSIYAPLPIVSSKRMNVGRIVQAFVRPAKNGYEAVPLIELGTKITPEIAAREIALRHGARGYFERASIEQAEETARTHDAAAEFAALRERLKGKGKPTYDLRDKEFVTIDPKGAGDLDDAFYIEKHPDGGWTWYLATADVAHFVKPGTPAFRAAARIGNTFYSIDKEGVPEFPMNHPVVSKSAASLLDGKDSLAMITAMRFGPDGKFLLEKSDVAIGIVNVKGRYDYDQVAALWQGAKDTGVRHAEQIALARQLSKFLTRQDVGRGKLDFNLPELRHSKKNGAWVSEDVTDAPITRESHRLIEELKVYGNRVIATRLNMSGAPHISRVHEEQADAVNERLREELKEIGVPWTKGTPAEYLEQVRANKGLTKRQVEVAQILVRNSRRAAKYAAEDSEGHEGLALEAGAYDHPSAPIRRFSDMYNRALLEAYLAGESPADVHAAVLRDLKSLGFADFDEYLEHLNGRAMASRQMDYEVDDFMSVYELAKPENRGKTFTGYVVFRRKGADARVEIKLEGTPATVTLRGREAGQMRLLEEVQVEVLGANLDLRSVDFRVRRKRG